MFLAGLQFLCAGKIAKRAIHVNSVTVLIMRVHSRGIGAGNRALDWSNSFHFCWCAHVIHVSVGGGDVTGAGGYGGDIGCGGERKDATAVSGVAMEGKGYNDGGNRSDTMLFIYVYVWHRMCHH